MRYLVLLLGLILTLETRAQFGDSLSYYTSFTSTGTYNRTNSVRQGLLNNALKFSVQKKRVSAELMNKWLYGQQNDKLTNNDLSSAFDLNLYSSLPRFNYWGMVHFTSSYSLRINGQLQGGIGVAYRLIDKKRITLNISDGIIYDYSNIIVNDTTEQYETFRNSLRVKIKGSIGSLLTYQGSGFYQPSLQYANDYIIKSELGLDVHLKKWLRFTVKLTYNEMSRTRTQNLFLTYGFVFEKYF